MDHPERPKARHWSLHWWLLAAAKSVGVAVALVAVSLAMRLAFNTIAPAALETVAYDSPEELAHDLDRGLDPNTVNYKGLTLLHAAASDGALPKVAALVEHGANPNAQDSLLRTPLHLAAEGGHFDVCRYLLAHGADKSLKEEGGRAAADVARARGYIQLATLLEQSATPSDGDR